MQTQFQRTAGSPTSLCFFIFPFVPPLSLSSAQITRSQTFYDVTRSLTLLFSTKPAGATLLRGTVSQL